MRKYLLPGSFLILVSMFCACGSGNGKKHSVSDTVRVVQDTLPVSAFDIHTLKDSGSVSLEKWIRTHLGPDTQKINLQASVEFLKIIHYPKQVSNQVYLQTIRDTLDSNQYLTFVYDQKNCLLVFRMDTVSKRISAAEDWTDESVDHLYGVKRFGRNYLLTLGNTINGTNNTWSFIFNNDLKKLLVIKDIKECWSDEPYSSQEMRTTYTLEKDSLLHVTVQFRNRELEKVKKDYKMQLHYTIRHDTVLCTTPDQLKDYDKKCKEFSME